MKVAIYLGLCLVLASGQDTTQKVKLPDLHRIYTATLSPSYSCRPREEFRKGYETTALFLTSESKAQRHPELVFNGACGSKDYFESSTAGDDMSLVADLGTVPLEQATAHLAFNPSNVVGGDAKFTRSSNVQAKHTYAAVINSRDMRGLLVFTVEEYVPNTRVVIRYAVKEYQLLETKSFSPGFSWDMPNRD